VIEAAWEGTRSALKSFFERGLFEHRTDRYTSKPARLIGVAADLKMNGRSVISEDFTGMTRRSFPEILAKSS